MQYWTALQRHPTVFDSELRLYFVLFYVNIFFSLLSCSYGRNTASEFYVIIVPLA